MKNNPHWIKKLRLKHHSRIVFWRPWSLLPLIHHTPASPLLSDIFIGQKPTFTHLLGEQIDKAVPLDKSTSELVRTENGMLGLHLCQHLYYSFDVLKLGTYRYQKRLLAATQGFSPGGVEPETKNINRLSTPQLVCHNFLYTSTTEHKTYKEVKEDPWSSIHQ